MPFVSNISYRMRMGGRKLNYGIWRAVGQSGGYIQTGLREVNGFFLTTFGPNSYGQVGINSNTYVAQISGDVVYTSPIVSGTIITGGYFISGSGIWNVQNAAQVSGSLSMPIVCAGNMSGTWMAMGW